jgi:hypothetical protein
MRYRQHPDVSVIAVEGDTFLAFPGGDNVF